MQNKLNILYIQDKHSTLDINSKTLLELFETADLVDDTKKALKLINSKTYDIVINDATHTGALQGTSFMKEIKEHKPKQEIVAFVAPEDEGKLSEMVDLGIHSFLLTPADLEQALGMIPQMKFD